ncbi:hypothetical protein PTI45_03379 [Paenibacillus nuruki]|uniref:Uncharacterized protein n=1 Tax=Paenibacillus nuruki TaxID=1886670 RepID=A0A1E3L0N5_9BACL|nr:hypothetical protein PTI45_03379 [Paenibacillus nuruki]
MFRSKQSKIVLVVGIIFVLWLILVYVVRNVSAG